MKKIFSSIISLAAAVACASGGGVMAGYAEAVNTVQGVYESDSAEFVFEDAEELNLSFSQTPEILSNFSSTSYNYGDFLDENNYAVYEALADWVTPSLDAVTVELPETVTLTLTGLPGSEDCTAEDEEAFSNAIFENCKPGIDSVLFDYPEIFWLDTSGLGIGVGNATYSQNRITKKYTLKITSLKFTPAVFESYGSLETAEEYKEKLETAIDSFEVEGETRYEQLKSIHDTIITFTYYDEPSPYSSSAIGSLVEPGVVCEGYSKGFKLMCDRLDIPCVLVFGNYDAEQNVAHMWNYVQMEDDNWYAVDVTWDDLDGSNGQEVKYAYFLKGSDNFFLNHTEETDYLGTILTYPAISASDYESGQTAVPETTTTTTEPVITTTTTTTCTMPFVPDETTTTTTTAPIVSTTTTTPTCTVPIDTTTTTTTTTEPAVTTTTVITTSVPQPEANGDYNSDGKVNSADMVICARNLIGVENEIFCDFNGDMSFNIFDLLLMRRYILESVIK